MLTPTFTTPGAFLACSPEEAATARHWAARMRNEVKTTYKLLEGRICKLEADIRRKGFRTSKEGKELYHLKKQATYLLISAAGFRSIIREIENPGCGMVMHCDRMKTCRGLLEVSPRYQGIITGLMAAWTYFGSGITNLGVAQGACEHVSRTVASLQALPEAEFWSEDEWVESLRDVCDKTVRELTKFYVGQVTARTNQVREVAAVLEHGSEPLAPTAPAMV